MDKAGREGLTAALGPCFSGDEVNARVADGVRRWDELAEVLVRSEALRERRNVEPKSVTELAMLCLLAWLRDCGVVDTLCAGSYWSAGGGEVSIRSSSRLSSGGGVGVGGERSVSLLVLFFLPKKEGRRANRLLRSVAMGTTAHGRIPER